MLTNTHPPALVDQVVAEAGRREERQQLLPARVVVWLVLAMALFSGLKGQISVDVVSFG